MPIQRFPHLAHWGAYTAVVDDGVLTGCEPFAADRDPSPMLAAIAPAIYADSRIRKPAVRRSWLQRREHSDRSLRGREEFVEVEWDEALALVAEENQRVRDRHGPGGLFTGSYGWSSAGRLHHARSLVRRFYFSGGGGVDQVGNYSWGAAQFFLPHVIGTFSPLTGRVTDWQSVADHADVLVAFGGLALKNAQVASGGAGEHTLKPWLARLAAQGTPVINISPTRDDCPAFLNAEWIPIRPNTDVALMLALGHEIDRLGAVDDTFMATYCTGWPPLRAYLYGSSDGVAKTPAWAAAITGIPAARIRQLAQQLIGVRSFITCAYAVQRAHRGEQPYWMMIALSAMLGQIGLPGGGFSFGHGSMNSVGNPRHDTPGPSMPAVPNPAGLAIPVARIADMLLNPGAPYSFQGETHHYPDVKLVHWAGGNPFHHHQQLNRLLAGWEKPETIIVQDIWWTPAAKLADIVLPVTSTLERNDIGGSSRDRYVFAMHQAIAPLHQARNDFDIFSELAERLGYRDAFTGGRDEQAWLRHIYQQCGEAQAGTGVTWPDFDTFWQRGHVELPQPSTPYVFFERFRQDPQRHPLKTPSGKIELYSETLAGFGHADMAPHPQWQPPVEWLGDAAAARWPLHLITVQPSDRLHSQLDQAPLAQGNKTAGKETIQMRPDDAAARGLREGGVVRVHNARGACLAGLRLNAGLAPGVVVMATGAWFDPGFGTQREDVEQAGNPNVLTLDIGTSSLTQGPNAMSCLVEVSAVETPPQAVGKKP
ncbi:molybdopterin guanine dinucleotide-containing S/N-oxide reductase [Chimaeribacter arupi]|uniref:Asp-tRNA(Asn)/Glu-tRNA(Gln) amidotransferase GatCAB subunit C n=1 Tax=Chimaeribacter arupi TaxID=2060066 RepID=A0A2N5EMZ1_9GAMM|nr:molybdopterin guanine dinucleotide-containing S/N-oxide reductase [Chimaeribacter arupi]PLR49819.1 Asp-tRNA(Asn)/Glu-tRNA(Gln) amidotransferase GatCAB subunit C [Chimaeribacter arupi]